MRADPPEIGFPATDDDERWKKEADDLRHQGLGAMREAAGKWHDSIAVLLGVFSVVAFIKGPESLTELDDPLAFAVAGLILGAAVLAGVATFLAALAAQGSPKIYKIITGPLLQNHHAQALETVARQLWWSRVLAIVAALLIASSVGVTWLATIAEDKKTTVNALVITKDGRVACGPVQDGTVRVSGASAGALQDIRAVQVVDQCPNS